MIKTINSWRGLMAVAVVLFHCNVAWIYNVAVSGAPFCWPSGIRSSVWMVALTAGLCWGMPCACTRCTGSD